MSKSLINERKRFEKVHLNNRCQICGDTAVYSSFGVDSCHPCRMFFKRHAENQQKIRQCSKNNQCIIDVKTRKKCGACRLKKCFDIGMEVSRIRHSVTIKSKSRTMMMNFPTLNLLQDDHSLLTAEQWTLLTNLVNHYDVKKLFSLTDQINCIDNNHLMMNVTLAEQFVELSYETSAQSFRLNRNINEQLSSNDRSLLLPTALDNINCLAATYIFAESHLNENDPYKKFIEQKYGKFLVDRYCWYSRYTQSDLILFKLILPLFMLSNSSRVSYPNLTDEFENIRTMNEIENQYATVMWKYLLYRYQFRDAVQIYVQLIRWLLATTMLSHDCHYVATHLNNMQTLIEETEMKLVLDDNDRSISEMDVFSLY